MQRLPERFLERHEYSITLYNQILSLFKSIDKINLLKIHMEPRSPADAEALGRLKGEDLRAWLQENGYSDAVYGLDYRNCLASLLTDALQFILAALNCSEKGQLNVAYSLLRKPFKDNLFYLEYLLAYPKEFVACYNDRACTEKLAFGDQAINEEKILLVIGEALQKTGSTLFTAAGLYDLRFNKANPLGLEPLFERSIRMETGHRYYVTEERTIGFAFSDEEEKDAQWELLYQNLPSLMLYMFSLVSKIVENITKLPKYWSLLQARYLLSLIHIANDHNFMVIKEHFQEIFKDLHGSCGHCGETILYDESQFVYFTKTFGIKCQSCANDFKLVDIGNDIG